MEIHPSFTKIWIYTILAEVALFLPWPKLILWFHFPAPAPEVAAAEIRSRMMALLSPYVPLMSRVRELFALLEEHEGIIIGPVATQLLLSAQDTFHDVIPRLDIVVPLNDYGPLHSFFVSLGFTYGNAIPPSHLRKEVTDVEALQKITDGKVIRVRIIACKARPLSVLMSSPTTAHMNAISPRYVYSMYPGSTYSNKAIAFDGFDPTDLDLDAFGSLTPLVSANNAFWTKGCGVYCAMKWRISYTDPGVAKYPWTMDPNSNAAVIVAAQGASLHEWGESGWAERRRDLMNQEMIRWRLGPRCWNPNCTVGQLYDRLMEYVTI